MKTYGLVDPRDGVIKYVGATILPLPVRLKEHHKGRNRKSKLAAWLRELVELGFRPRIVWLADGDREEEFIKSLRPDKNTSPTGKTCLGYHHTDEAKERIRDARTGVPLSAEHVEKLRAAHTGTKWSDARRQAYEKRYKS